VTVTVVATVGVRVGVVTPAVGVVLTPAVGVRVGVEIPLVGVCEGVVASVGVLVRVGVGVACARTAVASAVPKPKHKSRNKIRDPLILCSFPSARGPETAEPRDIEDRTAADRGRMKIR
jgi:hypothetical protein